MAAAILNHHPAALYPQAQAPLGKAAAPMAASTDGTGSTSSSDTSSATISGNDFLTLLVTEMQNQDPTATTDPNEYINQLVQVNSLEQLININQTLSTALGSSSTTPAASNHKADTTAVPCGTGGQAPVPAEQVAHGPMTAGAANAFTAHVSLAPGNLSVPAASPAADRVAHALEERSHAQPLTGGLAGVR